MAKEKYKKNLMCSLLNLGYDGVQDFNKYARKCMKLYDNILLGL